MASTPGQPFSPAQWVSIGDIVFPAFSYRAQRGSLEFFEVERSLPERRAKRVKKQAII